MLQVKFIYNWPSHYGEILFETPLCILIMLLNKLPLEQGLSLHMNKVEFRSPKNLDEKDENRKSLQQQDTTDKFD